MSNKVVSVYYDGKLVGKLAQTEDRRIVFEYDGWWLQNGFAISPFELPLEKKVFVAHLEPFGIFGVFNDSLPDGWGKLLIDRLLRKQKIEPKTVSTLDRLCLVGKNGMGALEYQPEHSLTDKQFDEYNLHDLEKQIQDILKHESTNNLEELVEISGSSGGARPKVLIKIDSEDWLVKFQSKFDKANIGQLEFDYSQLAKKSGLVMSETRLFEDKYFGTKRFDRLPGGKKVHMLSLAGLLNENYRLPSLDYIQVLQATLQLTKSFVEVEKMFRLMCFNVLIGNKDDHAKNFSFLFLDNEWQVSPAYDLVKNDGLNGEHATMINGKGTNVEEADVLAVAQTVGLNGKRAKKIWGEVVEAVSRPA